MTRYRDRDTGRFVSRSTWTRSRAHGGTRYKRERTEPVRLPPPKAPPGPPAIVPTTVAQWNEAFEDTPEDGFAEEEEFEDSPDY